MRLLICLVLLACPLSAMAVYRCEAASSGAAERTVTYSDTPCQHGKSVAIDPSQNTVSVVHEADRHLEQQKEEARRLERDRHRREAQEDKEARKAAATRAAQQKKCARLAQHQRWREEDAAVASGRAVTLARLRARHSAEAYQLECS